MTNKNVFEGIVPYTNDLLVVIQISVQEIVLEVKYVVIKNNTTLLDTVVIMKVIMKEVVIMKDFWTSL